MRSHAIKEEKIAYFSSLITMKGVWLILESVLGSEDRLHEQGHPKLSLEIMPSPASSCRNRRTLFSVTEPTLGLSFDTVNK